MTHFFFMSQPLHAGDDLRLGGGFSSCSSSSGNRCVSSDLGSNLRVLSQILRAPSRSLSFSFSYLVGVPVVQAQQSLVFLTRLRIFLFKKSAFAVYHHSVDVVVEFVSRKFMIIIMRFCLLAYKFICRSPNEVQRSSDRLHADEDGHRCVAESTHLTTAQVIALYVYVLYAISH